MTKYAAHARKSSTTFPYEDLKMSRAIIVLYIELNPSASATALEQWRTRMLKDIPSANWIRKVTASDKVDQSQPYREQLVIDLGCASDATEEVIAGLRSASNGILVHSDWHIYREIWRVLRQGVKPSDYPTTGTELVQVGMAPKPEAVQDYHDWFDKEHLGMLADIPGWRSTSRYEWTTSYGDGREIAWPFMSANEYEEENGLGGPIWQKSVDTPWTAQVFANLSKPNHRRTWKYGPL
jgi:hypothetical protein